MKKTILIWITSLLLIAFTNISSIASGLQVDWEPVNYEMDIRVDFGEEKMYADCKLTVKKKSDGAANEIPFLLYRLLKVTSITDIHNNDLSFSQNVTTVEGSPKLQVNAVQVHIPETITAGETYTIQIAYEGYIYGYPEGVGPYVREKIREPFTILREDTKAYPRFGYPSRESMFSIIYHSFDYYVSVTVPDHLVVANGGELISETRHDGKATYTYKSIKPSWRMDFAIAAYEIVEEDGIKIFYFPENKDGALRVLDIANRTLKLYTDWFGPLKDFKNFSIIQIPQGYGSQTDVTSILQAADVFESSDHDNQLYHEISHLWHPMETEPFPPSRWMEGLATFMEYYTVQEFEAREDYIHRASDAMRRSFNNSCNRIPNCPVTPLIDYGKEWMFQLSYTKGMILFHVLYELIGRDAFFNLVSNYYEKYYATGGSTHDLAAIIKELPYKGVSRFVDEWFYGTESNEYLAAGKSVKDIVSLYQK